MAGGVDPLRLVGTMPVAFSQLDSRQGASGDGNRLERSATTDGAINRRELLGFINQPTQIDDGDDVANDQYLHSVPSLPFSLATDSSTHTYYSRQLMIELNQFLDFHQLGQYKKVLESNDVDYNMLAKLTESDLVELGIY
jgi:hypothetical protein